jgi:phosphomannomutase
MCLCSDICYYYDILLRHNTELKRILCKYIDVIEIYICTLSDIQYDGVKILNPDALKPPQELLDLIHGLLADVPNPLCGSNDNNVMKDIDNTNSKELNEKKYSVFSLYISEEKEKCNNDEKNNKNIFIKCKKGTHKKIYKYIFERKDVSCIAKYCDKNGNVLQLKANDIFFCSDINEQVNKYVGFKHFLKNLSEIL